MPAAAASTTPTGYLGNLTEDQSYKLKQFYVALYKAVGELTGDLTIAGKAPEVEKKTGRFGFGSKKKETSNDVIEEAITLFKAKIGSTSPKTIYQKLQVIGKADNPDQLVLRFLRARKWDVAKAVEMFGNTLHWRTEVHDIEVLLEKGEKYWIDEDPDEGFINQFKTGKAIISGKDKEGCPIVFIAARKHDPRAQTEDAMERYTLFSMETAHLCLNEKETAGLIFDLGGFGLHNMDYHVVKFILGCFEAHYPESLGFVYIHRAPWVFNTVWSVIKGWIDPVVASKIAFTKNEKDLSDRIPMNEIPTELGGTNTYNYEWIPPSAGDDKPMADTARRDELAKERTQLWEQFKELTFEWIKTDSKEVDQKRQAVAADIAKNYWSIDPYVRARGIYDRNKQVGTFRKELASGGVAQPLL